MPPEYVHRNAGLIASANARLLRLGASCVIRASNLGLVAPVSVSSPEPKSLGSSRSSKGLLGLETEPETLGLFATSDIKKGEIILKDSTTAGCLYVVICGTTGLPLAVI